VDVDEEITGSAAARWNVPFTADPEYGAIPNSRGNANAQQALGLHDAGAAAVSTLLARELGGTCSTAFRAGLAEGEADDRPNAGAHVRRAQRHVFEDVCAAERTLSREHG